MTLDQLIPIAIELFHPEVAETQLGVKETPNQASDVS